MKNIKRNLIIGFEIETIINREIHPHLTIGYYHSGKRFNNYFTTERDSSLYSQGEFNINMGCEFVSKAFKSKKVFLKAIDSFIKSISKNNKYELNEVLSFNSSCGCHFHIGITKGKMYYQTINSSLLIELRKLFFNKIEKSKVLNCYEKTSIKNQYFRGYAKRLKPLSYDYGTLGRHNEFNIQSEFQNKGLEWRSVNLCNVRTWKSFKEALLIIYDCCEWLFKKRIKGYKLKSETVRLPRKELLKVIDKKYAQEEIKPIIQISEVIV